MTENDGPSCTHRPKAAVVAGTQPAQANQNSSMEGGGSHEFLPVTEERQRVMASGRGRIRFLYGCGFWWTTIPLKWTQTFERMSTTKRTW